MKQDEPNRYGFLLHMERNRARQRRHRQTLERDEAAHAARMEHIAELVERWTRGADYLNKLHEVNPAAYTEKLKRLWAAVDEMKYWRPELYKQLGAQLPPNPTPPAPAHIGKPCPPSPKRDAELRRLTSAAIDMVERWTRGAEYLTALKSSDSESYYHLLHLTWAAVDEIEYERPELYKSLTAKLPRA